ncbi:molybdopterin-dependent oxidoreductase [Streptomyces tendae]|uniref:molybdopterin-dependent oxidoreductase n=1 Tax=Streptomyces tendae TaxID=1932 RepID=UPI003D74E45D
MGIPQLRPRFRGRLHDPRTATVIGRLLGLAILICFVTGVISHYLQEPPSWLSAHLPTRPSWGYRFSQGLHVISGIAAVPLLLAKLWTVYPRLFVWPPLTSPAHAAERLSIAALVSATLLELFMGLLNTVQWYVWPFSFRRVHWALAWVIVGSLFVHLAVKAPLIAEHWRRPAVDPVPLGADASPAVSDALAEDLDRRSLLRGVTMAVGAVTLFTAGQSVTPLADVDLLAPRDPEIGPQGLPVNRTARAAGVTADLVDGWQLHVDGPQAYSLTLDELKAMPQHRVELPIACVEGWSKSAHWEGVRIKDLLARAGLPDGARLRVVSLQRRGGYGVTVMDLPYTRDDLTLLALRLNDEVLAPDHGYPARIIAPNRPGALQTKWVTKLEVLA